MYLLMFVDILLIKLNIQSKNKIYFNTFYEEFFCFSSSIDIPEFPIDINVVLELLVASDFLDC